MPDLRLDKLGTFTATGTNVTVYKVFLVMAGKGVTAASLEKDPNFAGPALITTQRALDQNGSASFTMSKFRPDIETKFSDVGHDGLIDSFVLAIGDSGKPTAAQGPSFTAKLDLIKKGENTWPPKKSDSEADMAAEKKWWSRLEETKVAELQPGDILIKKVFKDDAPVPAAQRVFSANHGSKYSGHVMLYVGGGKIIHAHPGGVVEDQPQKDSFVWRPKDPKQVTAAIASARWFAKEKLIYSMVHCLSAPFGDRSFGPKSQMRHEMVCAHELPVHRMMCSEMVCFAYQSVLNDPYIRIDPLRTAPMHVEDYLNDHPERFSFAGKLTDGVEAEPTTPEQGMQVMADELLYEASKIFKDAEAAKAAVEKAAAEAAAAAKAAAEKAAKAAAEAAAAVKAAAEKAAKAAADAAAAAAAKAKEGAKKVARFLGF